jgi:hypothetical protein
MKDYSKLLDITVKNQAELDEIPLDFKGHIYIDANVSVVVSNRYCFRVVAKGNSSVVAWGNSSVEACGDSSVVAWENSSVVAKENSSVEACGDSSVEANANVQVVDRQFDGIIILAGNARKVYMPKNIHEFMDFYGIKHDEKTAIFYKAVNKVDGKYVSNYNPSFSYTVGENKTETCNKDTSVSCDNGIHISHLSWALDFGKDWPNLAIIEVVTDIDNIVMPVDTDGKVRTSEVKVLREVPLEECGVYGKILARRRNSAS